MDIALSNGTGTSEGPTFLIEYSLTCMVTVKGSEKLSKGKF